MIEQVRVLPLFALGVLGGDNVALKPNEQEHGGREADDGPGGDQAPVVGEGLLQACEGQGKREVAGLHNQEVGPQKLAPVANQADDKQGDEGGGDGPEGDTAEGLPLVAAVKGGGVKQGTGDLLEGAF